MLQVILGVIRCISDFQKPWVSKTAALRVKDTFRSLCYPVLCGHCLPSCQAERQTPGLLVNMKMGKSRMELMDLTVFTSRVGAGPNVSPWPGTRVQKPDLFCLSGDSP